MSLKAKSSNLNWNDINLDGAIRKVISRNFGCIHNVIQNCWCTLFISKISLFQRLRLLVFVLKMVFAFTASFCYID